MTEQRLRRHFPLRVGPESIGWGILGTGQRAERMVDAIRQQPSATPGIAGAWAVGVYSHSERRAHSFAENHYLPHSFSNLADLLQRHEVQCIYIASHPRHHYALTMAALTAGKHVLVEPPLALSAEDAHTLQQTAEHRGLQLVLNHQLRFDPAFQQIKRLLADATIGDLIACRANNTLPLPLSQQSWRLQPKGGGVLLQRTYHTIDLLHYLLADQVSTIYATGAQHILRDRSPAIQSAGSFHTAPVEEEVHTLLTLRHHRFTVHLHDSFFLPHVTTEFALCGSQGAFLVEHWADPTVASQLWFVRNGQREQIPLPTAGPEQQSIYLFHQQIQQSRSNQGVLEQSALAPAQAGIDCLAVIAAAHQSMGQQRPTVPLNLP